MARVLVVDDERGVRFTLAELLREDGHIVDTAADANEARAHLAKTPFDVVVTDIILPGTSGMSLVEDVRAVAPMVQIVVITGEPTMSTAERAVRAGAFDYLPKPVTGASIRKVVLAAARTKESCDKNACLEREVERRAALFDAVPVGVVVTDRNMRVTDANHGYCALSGQSLESLRGEPPWGFVAEEDRAALHEALADGGEDAFHFNVQGLGGETFRISGARAGDFTLAVVDDVSSCFVEQLEAGQSKKMDAVASFAGSAAHDVNNILGAIMGFASLLQGELDPGAPTRSDVEGILSACRRGRDLTQGLLAFAREGRSVREEVHLNEVVSQVAESTRQATAGSCKVAVVLDNATPAVMGDIEQISRIVGSLCTNSVEAMNDSGQITLSTERIVLDSFDPCSPASEGGVYAMVRVQDEGVGMDPEVLEHAFEPLFSTKDKSKAANVSPGMGLAMVFAVVKHHKGKVTLESAPGQGTTVTIVLPAAVSQ